MIGIVGYGGYVPRLRLSRRAMAQALGGYIVLPPQEYSGLARIALIADPMGALVGLWQNKSDLTSDWTGAAPARGDAR